MIWRITVALWLVVSPVSTAWADARDEQVYDLDLPTQLVPDALDRLSEQTGVPVLFPYDLAKDLRSNAVKGHYTLYEALKRLLQGTGLSGSRTQGGMIVVSPETTPNSAPEGSMRNTTKADEQRATETTTAGAASEHSSKEGSVKQRGFFAALLALLVGSTAQAVDTSQTSPVLETLVVTATKTGELSLQDAPLSIAAFSSNALKNLQVDSLTELSKFLPNADFWNVAPGVLIGTIRGIGSSRIDLGNEQGIGFYLDGVSLQWDSSMASTVRRGSGGRARSSSPEEKPA